MRCFGSPAAVEHGSGHLLARTLVQETVERGIVLPPGQHITEAPGQGVAGEVEGHQVTVGGWSYVVGRHPEAEAGLRDLLAQTRGAELRAYVAVDGRGAGLIEYADRLRPELHGFHPAAPQAGRLADRSTLGRRSGERDGSG